ncbi:MAG: restriction endonuclease, partial [Prevotella sp.]|nr:restriction endonuclease [Prevotella sp.]
HCTKAVLATDGELLEDAIKVAQELNIEILYTSPMTTKTEPEKEEKQPQNNKDVIQSQYPSFDEVWEKYIMPLKGTTLHNSQGSNEIIDIDWSGIKRITSKNKKNEIAIEAFRFAYNTLINEGKVTREDINQEFAYCSSGIVLLLKQLPFVEIINRPITLRLK